MRINGISNNSPTYAYKELLHIIFSQKTHSSNVTGLNTQGEDNSRSETIASGCALT